MRYPVALVGEGREGVDVRALLEAGWIALAGAEEGLMSETSREIFWLLVAPPNDNGCRIYLGEISSKGYGRHPDGNGRKRAAHVVAWEMARGPVPEGLVLDHFRMNPAVNLPCSRSCVALEHLEPVTNAENVLRGQGPTAENARRTHCPAGHEYDRLRPQGWRECLTCRAISRRRFWNSRSEEHKQRHYARERERYAQKRAARTGEAK